MEKITIMFYSLVSSEAGFFELPILVSDRVGCIGPPGTAQPGRNAFVFPCGNMQQPGQAIELLYNDRSLYAIMSSNSTRIPESQDELVATQRIDSSAGSAS